MILERKIKKRIDHNLSELVNNPYKKKKSFPLWGKIAIPSLATAALVVAVIIPLSLNKENQTVDPLINTRLTTPKLEKVTTTNNQMMSQKTYDSYMAFMRKFSKLSFKVSNKDKEDSVGISIPDAYLCLAITGIISNDAARDDVLSYLELSSLDELREAVKEIISILCTLYQNKDGKLCGGYNLNSIWLNPEKVRLVKEKDEELYKDLEQIFDASMYYKALTSQEANNYLKENGLKDLPTPNIELNDDDPSALSVMSTFYCLDSFDSDMSDFYHEQYLSQKHKMTFNYLNNYEVDYIESQKENHLYENEKFIGSSFKISNLNMAFFLPNDSSALPSTIIDDVLNENYHYKTTMIDIEDNSYETDLFMVNIKAPYFSLDNMVSLEHPDLASELPIITSFGAGERIAEASFPMYLDNIKQFSTMKFNYDGFYSCSVTISAIEPGSMPPVLENYELRLDHPYVFEVRKPVLVNEQSTNLPLVVGEIVTPNYVD